MLDYPVPPPGPPGPFGTMAWLRATVSRFAEGEPHARRRAMIEARLTELDPAALRAAARAAAHGECAAGGESAVERGERAVARGERPAGGERAREGGERGAASGVALPYLPVAVLAAATGVAASAVAEVVAAVRVVAAAYHPGTDAPGADAALLRLLDRLPPDEPEAQAQHVALLVQACEATAALIRGEDPPVRSTKRLDANGNVVTIDLSDTPFGAGPRACPGREHALALAAGVNDVR